MRFCSEFCRKIQLQSIRQENAALPAVKSSKIAAEKSKKEKNLSQLYLKLVGKFRKYSWLYTIISCITWKVWFVTEVLHRKNIQVVFSKVQYKLRLRQTMTETWAWICGLCQKARNFASKRVDTKYHSIPIESLKWLYWNWPPPNIFSGWRL